MPEVRAAVAADERPVAALHRLVFPDYSSSALGIGFCTALIGAYRVRPDSAVLVLGDGDGDGAPVGYLVAAPPATQRVVNASLRGRALRATLAGLWRPSAWTRLATPSVRTRARSLLRRRPAPADDRAVSAAAPHPGRVPPGDEADIRVVLVGVHPDRRGRGGADALLAAFAAEARRRGLGRADLVVAADNRAAHRCYRRNGWAPEDQGGGGSVRFHLDLDAAGG